MKITPDTQDIQVTEKSIKLLDGSEVVAQILRMNDNENMTVSAVAEMLGVTPQAIRMEVMRASLVVTKCNDQILDSLKQLGVLAFKTTVANLLPKATIQALVKIINTPQAWAAYRQLWTDLQEPTPTRGDALRHMATAVKGVTDMSLLLSDRIEAVATTVAAHTTQHATSTLTTPMIVSIRQAIGRRAACMGLKGRRRVVAERTMMGAIKKQFLPLGVQGAMTWKESPQSAYDAILQFIARWDYVNTSLTARPRGTR